MVYESVCDKLCEDERITIAFVAYTHILMSEEIYKQTKIIISVMLKNLTTVVKKIGKTVLVVRVCLGFFFFFQLFIIYIL